MPVLLGFLLLCALPPACLPASGSSEAPAPRVAAIAGMLDEPPFFFGAPIDERAAWGRLAAQPAFRTLSGRAEKLLGLPLPPASDELFLEFSRSGNRTRWEALELKERRGRLPTLVLAECLEDRGRFLPAVNELVESLCAERSWVYSAHDGSLSNFKGTAVDIDLGSSALAWDLALTSRLLAGRLRPAAHSLIRENVMRRVLEPFRAMVSGDRKPNGWLTATHNWNAVCLAGVTGAALALVEERGRRAEYAAAAEHYIKNYLSGFSADGYCSEGLGYWNYGFGRFVLLAEALSQATRGGLDLFSLPKVAAAARFGTAIQIAPGVSPAFADCSVRAKPDPAIQWYVAGRLGPAVPETPAPTDAAFGSIFEAAMYAFPISTRSASPQGPSGPAGADAAGLRSWFNEAGILIGRPAEGSACRIGVALKGGHNAEHHNHNDVGSYVVAVGGRAVLLDPGPETYTARTFSKRRYESKLLNSYGHPVPIAAGSLQREGREASARVVRAEFGPESDTLVLDLASAYPVSDLKSLERSFVYSRSGGGSLTVTDRVAFARPERFGTALITRGDWRRLSDGTILILDAEEALAVEVDAGGLAYGLDPEIIGEDAPIKPLRLGVNLKEPAAAAAISLRITVWTAPGAGLLKNGGFELGGWGWTLPADGMGSTSSRYSAAGAGSLLIKDDDPGRGSNVASVRLPARASASYELRGQVLHLRGTGLGVYVEFFDESGGRIDRPDGRGNSAPLGTLEGANGVWTPFSYGFVCPSGAASMRVWLHSFNSARVEACLDELELRERE